MMGKRRAVPRMRQRGGGETGSHLTPGRSHGFLLQLRERPYWESTPPPPGVEKNLLSEGCFLGSSALEGWPMQRCLHSLCQSHPKKEVALMQYRRITEIVGALCLLAVLSTPASADSEKAKLIGDHEVPLVLTTGEGTLKAKLTDRTMIDFTLTYSGLEGTVTQAH